MGNISITVQIEQIDEIIETMSFLASAIAHKNGMKNTEEAIEELRDKAKTETEEEPKEDAAATSSDSKYTIDQVRRLFVDKNSPNNRNKLKELLTKYDAKNVSSLEPKHYEAVINELNEM